MIGRIQKMRTLSKKSRMQADSLPEIRRGLEKMAYDFKAEGHRVGNRPVSEGHIINAAVLVILAMPESQRATSVIMAFEKMNELLASDEQLSDANLSFAAPRQEPEEGGKKVPAKHTGDVSGAVPKSGRRQPG